MNAPANIETGMELYTAMIHARTAAEHLLITHVMRRNGNAAGADINHTQAMLQLDLMADALGIELVEKKVELSR